MSQPRTVHKYYGIQGFFISTSVFQNNIFNVN